jgi:hypothetical protein
MSSQSIVCATCDAAVPYGRLSCPSCGELLASVAGAARPAVARAVAKRSTRRAAPAVRVDGPPLTAARATPGSVGTGTLDWERTGWDASARGDDTIDLPVPDREPSIFQPVAGAGAVAVAGVAAPVVDAPPPIAPQDVAPQEVSPPAGAPQDVAAPPRAAPPLAASSATASAVRDAPGAYVPPLPATPAGPPAPARAWAGQPTADPATSEAREPRTAASDLLDGARVNEFVGWLAVAGSAMSAVGFLLPWGISVIGARGVGYFDRWGLAGPFHPIVFVSLLALLGLSLVPNPIPLWVRVGVPGLGLGALLVGLTWPYLVGLSGTGPGALVVAIGALILGVAGVVALVTDRHATEDRAV